MSVIHRAMRHVCVVLFDKIDRFLSLCITQSIHTAHKMHMASFALSFGSSNSLSGFSDEDDIKWQSDAIRRSINEIKGRPEIDPAHIQNQLDELKRQFPKGWKRMIEEDEKKKATIVEHKATNDLVVIGAQPALTNEPDAIIMDEESDVEQKPLWRRVYEFVKQNVIRVWNYFFT